MKLDHARTPSSKQSVDQTGGIETMRVQHVAMAAVLAVAPEVVASMQDHLPNPETKAHVQAPVWPTNGIAEREFGDGKKTWPENMFVEHSRGRWIAWVLVSPERGQAKALDFFSGEVQDVKVKKPGGYNDSFVDEKGATHVSNSVFDFHYKDPRPGGAIGDVQINEDSLQFDELILYAPILDVSQRVSPDDDMVIWRKVPLYCDSFSSGGSCIGWASLIGTAMDLRDGTMLIAGGKYVFRVRQDDLAPVGRAPHFHVVDEADVQRVIDKAEGSGIKDAHEFLIEQLHLR
ncbi:hypothetical protein [Luteibacter sp. W1I16]|uniref:hypothetical protein n=1 Tax=Luteibacter sp. W1I16 TaxID=3373922 RepID=UPI003D22ED90